MMSGKQLFHTATLVFCLGMTNSALGTDDAAAVLKEAESLLKEAVALQGGWTSTQDLIKDAQKQLAGGNKAKALPLAQQARAEAKLSLERAKVLKENWSVPKYITDQ